MRCPYFAGHSRGTAELVEAAAALLPAHAGRDDARRAGPRSCTTSAASACPGSVWDKPGPLSGTDRERMRLHVYYVERIFNRPEPLRRIGLLAATHHERMDGSGYHRGVGATMLTHAGAGARRRRRVPRDDAAPPAPRRADRERRRAPTPRPRPTQGRLDHARDRRGARRGRAHDDTVRAPADRPGLTTRETDVLGLLAQGLPNKAIASELGISRKTVGNHVEHIYTKLGVTNRAGAAMRAMQYGIVEPTAAPTSS